ncbi:MAG: hypothetical protein H7331_05940 [Bacteroidia bacterium]|nr:hypothetical protein [Bacteroidia bacterium]
MKGIVVNNTELIKNIEFSLFDKNEEPPENILKIKKFKSQKETPFEIIRQDEIVDVIESVLGFNSNKKIYIGTWDSLENIYELTLDNQFKQKYLNFMYEPESFNNLIQPKHPFAIMYDSIFIFDENKILAIVADRYYDTTFIYNL